MDARVWQPGPPASSGGFWRSFEEYRYDALGRRIATKLDQACDDIDAYHRSQADCRINGIRRTLWDGSAELGEIQVPNGGLENDSYIGQGDYSSGKNLSPFYGAVAYTYDGAIDQPLAVTRLRYANWTPAGPTSLYAPFTFYPLWNAHGQSTGGIAMSPPENGCSDEITPGARVTCLSYVFVPRSQWLPYQRLARLPRAWQGSLLEEKQGAGGLMYRRNRYYDGTTGRFTQEDPIGLAGGMNVYGFAAGDPINYSDPFGLDTLSAQEREKLGDLCTEIDCRKINVFRGRDGEIAETLRDQMTHWTGRSVTHGYNIFLADDDTDDFGVLAHEVHHVTQYEKWGAETYYKIGVATQLGGGHPYTYTLNGRRLGQYRMEQQGQIVEDCYHGVRPACWAASRR